MSFLWQLIQLAYAPLGAYGALVEGSTRRDAQPGDRSAALVA